MKKVYRAPATPCDRLIAYPAVEDIVKETLATKFRTLDLVRLLQQIRIAQPSLSDIATFGATAQPASGKSTTFSYRPEQYLDLAHRAGGSRKLRQLVRNLVPALPPMTSLPLAKQLRAKLDEVLPVV